MHRTHRKGKKRISLSGQFVTILTERGAFKSKLRKEVSCVKTTEKVRYLTEAAVIAAVYCVLTVALPFMTFGQVQLRLAEALTVLPVFMPSAVSGLFVGCLLSNAIGLTMGANVAGALDILVGALTTGAAALLTRRLRRIRMRGLPVLATLPPVVLNALAVGAELTVALYGWDLRLFAVNAVTVGAGELLSATGGGLILYTALRGRLRGEEG